METINVATFCTGIGAVECALSGEPGWRVVAMAEIEPFPCAVLKKHYPGVPNYGDITKIKGSDLPPGIRVMVAGTPCQSFSVAGLRQGLNDDRGNLTFEYVRIIDEYEQHHGAAVIAVWENVPGIFSDRGNAFGCFLAALAGEDEELQAPGGGWTHAGYVLGPRRSIAWRLLDAQYFGVAQRRKRVFVVASPCAGPDPRKILFEFDGRRRDTPPCREKGTELAGTLEGSLGRSRGAGTSPGAIVNALTGALGQGGADDNRAQAGFYVPEIVSQAMSCKWSKGSSGPAGDEPPGCGVHPQQGRWRGDDGRGYDRPPHVSDLPILDTHKVDMVVTPILEAGKRTGASTTDNRAGMGIGAAGDPMFTLQSGAQHAVSVSFRGRGGGSQPELHAGVSTAQRGGTGGASKAHVLAASTVRRLMPMECELLQGFPGGYTLINYRAAWSFLPPAIINRSYRRYLLRARKQGFTPLDFDKLANCPDGPRYKALGNSMAVPVMRWILRRVGAAIRGNM